MCEESFSTDSSYQRKFIYFWNNFVSLKKYKINHFRFQLLSVFQSILVSTSAEDSMLDNMENVSPNATIKTVKLRGCEIKVRQAGSLKMVAQELRTPKKSHAKRRRNEVALSSPESASPSPKQPRAATTKPAAAEDQFEDTDIFDTSEATFGLSPGAYDDIRNELAASNDLGFDFQFLGDSFLDNPNGVEDPIVSFH